MLFYRAALPLSRSTQQDPLVLAVRREALLLPGSLGRPALVPGPSRCGRTSGPGRRPVLLRIGRERGGERLALRNLALGV